MLLRVKNINCDTGLDKLWTPEDYLTIWWTDPDAEPHDEFDRSGHRALMEQRQQHRLFSRNTLGDLRPVMPANLPQNVDPAAIGAAARAARPPPVQEFYRQDENEQV